MVIDPNQTLVYVAVFVVGLILGAILFSSGRKWKRKYEDERIRYDALKLEHQRLVDEYRPGTAIGDLDLRPRS